MKATKRLYFIIAPLICITLYSAEKRNTPEAEYYSKIFGDWLTRTNNLDPETLKKVQQEESEKIRKEMANNHIQTNIRWGYPVPAKTILEADAETAALAQAHNQKLAEQLQAQQPK